MHLTDFPKPCWKFSMTGATDGVGTADAPQLKSDLFDVSTNHVHSIRIPKGMKMSIDDLEVMTGGNATAWVIQYTLDITAAVPTWVSIFDCHNVTRLRHLEKPIEIGPSTDGKLAVRPYWTQTVADALSSINLHCRVYEED